MAELMEMLTNRTVDFVLAFRPTVRNEEIESHVLFDNHLAVIVKDSHSLASRERISLTDGELAKRYIEELPNWALTILPR